jgi:hypothetical protein
VRAGAKGVYATDAGVFTHGLNARPFRITVARHDTDAGDPPPDIKLLERVEVVIRGGVLYSQGHGKALRMQR